MPKTITILLPALIVFASAALTRREWTLFIEARAEPSDLFPYTLRRLSRRLAGVAILLSLGGTLAALGLVPPTDARSAARYEVLLLAGVMLLMVLSIWDFWAAGHPHRRRVREELPPRPPSGLLH